MFGDWDDDDWCEFDNYMIGCLIGYLKHGLLKAKFVNLKIRQLSAETCHEFIEWCGLVDGQENNGNLPRNIKLYKNDLFAVFCEEFPDYAKGGRMSISRTKFYKWLISYAVFKEGVMPEDDRDIRGRYIVIKENHGQIKLNDD